MEATNSGNVTNAQLQNWDNFCQHHAIGNWYGTWTKYNTEAKVIDTFQCIRSLYTNADKSSIEHQNHYIYVNGETETKKFGPYKKPITKALFLENSFSWGSDVVESNSPFGFEIGFKHQERRVSIAILYGRDGKPENITTISEYLNNFVQVSNNFTDKKSNDNWQGTLTAIGYDLLTEPSKRTLWREIEELSGSDNDYYIFHFPNDISAMFPRQVESNKEMFMAADWQVNSTLLLRGIRHFSSSGFKHFTLETFRLVVDESP